MQVEEQHESSLNFLRSMNTSGGFTMPEGYELTMTDRLLAISRPDEVLVFHTEGGFEVPSLYFETVETRLMKQVPSSGQEKLRKLRLTQTFLWAMSAAATISLVGFLWLNQHKTVAIEPTAANWNKVSEDEMIEHLESTDVTPEMLCEAGWCEELKKPAAPQDIETQKLLEETETFQLLDEL